MRRQSGMRYLKVLGIALLVIIVGALVYELSNPRLVDHVQRTSCLNNLKQIGTALMMYESDWDDRLPIVSTSQRVREGKAWSDKILAYARNQKIIVCPGMPDRLAYSFNRRLSGVNEGDYTDQAKTVLAFESVNDSTKNNNLNGDTLWNPKTGGLPKSGQFVQWPKHADRYCRNWPAWAEPRHQGRNNVLFWDAHAEQHLGWDYEPDLTPQPRAK